MPERHPGIGVALLMAGLLLAAACWFDVGSADVYAHEPDLGWVLIDEEEGERILGEPVE